MKSIEFSAMIGDYIARTSIPENINAKEAVVLERLARGGGATNWFFCPKAGAIDDIARRLSPGSVVSFYFDGRIARSDYSADVKMRIEELVSGGRECMVGVLADDGPTIDVEFITAPSELAEIVEGLAPSSMLFFGEFPGRDDDGVNAVTVTLPDADGVVRCHPH